MPTSLEASLPSLQFPNLSGEPMVGVATAKAIRKRAAPAVAGTPERAVEPIKLRKIVACIDGSPYSEKVVVHAARAAAALDAELTLLRVIERRTGAPPDPVAWDIETREARHALGKLAEARGVSGTPIRTEVIEGDATEQIRQWVKGNAIDLTVFATHGDRGVTDWGMGSTARKLLDSVSGSLFLVPGEGLIGNGVSYRNILVPLDGSAYAESVLPLATRLADGDSTRVVLAHVVPVPELTETAPMENEARDLRERLVRRNRRVADEYLRRMRAQSWGGVDVQANSQVADVRTGLAAIVAEENPDLIVLSAYGRGRRADVPFGGVASYLISRTRVPLLVVRGRQRAAAQQQVGAANRLPAFATR